MTPDQQRALADVAVAYCGAKGWKFSRDAGQGAFKATFRIETPDGRVLALKVYLDGGMQDRTAREIQAMIEVSTSAHPSLPRFSELTTFTHASRQHDLSIEEFLSGGSLGQALEAGPLALPAVIRLGQELAAALAIVAAKKLVHRDIKPDNILFRDSGTAVLVDFGIVRFLEMKSLTDSFLVRGPGTYYFSAPEQLKNEKQLIDHRTDQFSLGICLAIAAHGTHPYARDGDAPQRVVERVAARQPPHAPAVARLRAEGLAPVAKMIEPWSAARYRLPQELTTAWAEL